MPLISNTTLVSCLMNLLKSKRSTLPASVCNYVQSDQVVVELFEPLLRLARGAALAGTGQIFRTESHPRLRPCGGIPSGHVRTVSLTCQTVRGSRVSGRPAPRASPGRTGLLIILLQTRTQFSRSQLQPQIGRPFNLSLRLLPIKISGQRVIRWFSRIFRYRCSVFAPLFAILVASVLA